jgi:hypothetical protein
VDPFEHGLSGPVWEVVGTVGANGGCCYEFNVPTHCDSGPTGDYWTQFCVTAHTGVIGEHFDSPVDSGYSVDNLGMLNLTSQRKPGAGDAGAVTSTGLEIPRPNPGKDGFNIRFTLAADDWIQLAVYDINGRRVASIREGLTPAGAHEATWKADSEMGDRLSPGLYFVRLVTTREVATVKLLHL